MDTGARLRMPSELMMVVDQKETLIRQRQTQNTVNGDGGKTDRGGKQGSEVECQLLLLLKPKGIMSAPTPVMCRAESQGPITGEQFDFPRLSP